MGIHMVGLDYETAGVAVRERFSLTAQRLPSILQMLRQADGVQGCVLLSTCNRTEAYYSCAEGHHLDGGALLCDALGLPPALFRESLRERDGRAAALHLMQVAGGLRSQILGEEQILAQVKRAIACAQEAKTCDAALQTLFRLAVTGGKQIRSRIQFAKAGKSVAGRAVEHLQEAIGDLTGKHVLVIGNGETGRLAAELLLQRGCRVSMTVRSYHSGDIRAAEGCAALPYDARYLAFSEADAVLSATTSPHHTVTLGGVRELARYPRYFVDLAVPRDVDPAVAELPGVTLWNVDDLSSGQAVPELAEQRLAAEQIALEQAARFEAWQAGRLQRQNSYPRFPLFVDLHARKVLVAGGGQVALRRVRALLAFGPDITVVAPKVVEGLTQLAREKRIHWIAGEYAAEHMEETALAIAATDSRTVNRRVGRDAAERGIPVSVADSREECTFWFPAVVHADNLVAGLVSVDGDHALVRDTAALLRREIGEKQ